MAYNKKNLLRKIVEIQTLVLAAKKSGATQVWIYRNLISTQYHISESTFNNYLSINAKRELEIIDKLEEVKQKQLEIF